jgi:hypothetical protein
MKAPTMPPIDYEEPKKTRYAPIPDFLRDELEDWNKTVEGELIFPSSIGTMYCRPGRVIQDFLKAGARLPAYRI